MFTVSWVLMTLLFLWKGKWASAAIPHYSGLGVFFRIQQHVSGHVCTRGGNWKERQGSHSNVGGVVCSRRWVCIGWLVCITAHPPQIFQLGIPYLNPSGCKNTRLAPVTLRFLRICHRCLKLCPKSFIYCCNARKCQLLLKQPFQNFK